jgi:hypothetical protein
MLEKMGESLESFGDRNLFADEKLAELADQARNVVNGLSTDEFRQDANLRRYIADEMNHLRISVDEALEEHAKDWWQNVLACSHKDYYFCSFSLSW